VTCTESGHRVLAELAPTPEKASLVYHGLDFTRFPEPPLRVAKAQGPTVLLSVGRLVPKKGYAGLIEALGRLPKDLDWRLRHVGGGPLKDALQSQAQQLGIADRITWLGAQPQETVLEEYRGADLFILNSRIAEDGDRDGLPNVLMEAQSQRLAVIATNLAGIPELVIDGETGALVPPDDPAALAEVVVRLLRDAGLRDRMAQAGYARVRGQFSMERGIAELGRRFLR
jgi:glycosyltransferase involved in cell wall biosynthesis